MYAAGGGTAAFAITGTATGAGTTGVGAGAGGKGGSRKLGQTWWSAAVLSSHDTRPSAVADPHSSLVVAAMLLLTSIEAALFARSATVEELAKAAWEYSHEVAALAVVKVLEADTLED